MKDRKVPPEATQETGMASPRIDEVQTNWQRVVRRRSFLRGVGVAGAAALPAGKLFGQQNNGINKGDAALLRFAAAIEFIEADLWQQYNELGGQVDHNDNPNPGNPAYIAALQNLDGDMPQYISDNTDDEISHRDFLNAYLKSKNVQPIDFTQFETLSPTTAAGALPNGRLTNLQKLTVDTSWYFRYRSTQNPDLGAQFPQLLKIANQPAIPLHDNNAQSTIQAIANVAGIHFAYIEQGGSSLYATLAEKVTSLEVLRIVSSIGPAEAMHFATWQDDAGNAANDPVAPVTDPVTGLTIPNLDADPRGALVQANLIFPTPAEFIAPKLPRCAVVRPTLDRNGGAVATIKSFTADRLFEGQSPKFFRTVLELAREADAAQRSLR